MNNSFPASLTYGILGYMNFHIFIETVNRFTANVIALTCTNFSLNDVGHATPSPANISKGDIPANSLN